MGEIGLGLVGLSLLIWLVLLCFWGQFWRTDQPLEAPEFSGLSAESKAEADESAASQLSCNPQIAPLPTICAVIPARNEAEVLPKTVRSLLTQDYPGAFHLVLVDDHSTDGTAEVAKDTAAALGKSQQLHLLTAAPLPAGWSGKLWAIEQGIQHAKPFAPDYLLLTDADIEHDPASLSRLVAKAVQQDLDLTSVMVRLRCESFWEKFLIPAFVFFFQKLYPFRWVNDPHNSTAAAAGGCILIRRAALDRIGGIQAVRQALIDDCALAKAVKVPTGKSKHLEKRTSQPAPETSGKIWLGLSDRTRSLRPYPSLQTIWEMVARTAFTQLNYSPLLLLGTLVGMALVYLAAPLGLVMGIAIGNHSLALAGLLGWLLMALAYLPMVRFYRCSPLFALSLPAIAFLYSLMTLDSALRHWQGRGGAWKGRVYEVPKP